jgi:flagellar protein FlaI
MTSIDEIADYENYHKAFEWDPAQDIFNSSLGNSALINKLSKHLGVSQLDLMEEMARRRNVLAWMRTRKIRSYNDVAAIIAEYYSRPEEFYKRRVEPTVSVQHS